MKIYVCHPSSYDYKNLLYHPLQQSKLWAKHHWFLPHLANNLPIHTKEIISEADLIIAEVSLPSTGMGIELGWAESLNRPILFIHRQDIVISSSLHLISSNFIQYKNSDDMLDKMANYLQNHQL